MNWQDSSELVAGLVISGKLASSAVRPNLFMPPYDKVIEIYKEGGKLEDIITGIGSTPVQTCMYAVESVNGLGERADWVKVLEQSYSQYRAGEKLSKLSSRLSRGEQIDWSVVTKLAQQSQELQSDDFVALSDVESGSVPFIETGWTAIDEHLGGIPEVGLIQIAGNPGAGKTTCLTKLAAKFAERHPNKVVVIYSIEMILKELAARIRDTTDITKDVENRIMLSEYPVSPEEAINRSATIENLGLVGIDFADLMIRGETSESSMAHIYRTLMIGAKQLGVPVILLSQLSRNYQGGIPRPQNIRYTSLAEALSWMILMVYNPTNDYFAELDGDILPIRDNTAYICAWKVRGGFRKHINESPGAIALPFRGDKGWGDGDNGKSKWYPLKGVN